MTIEEKVMEKLRELPPEKQKEVLAFVDSLDNKSRATKKLRSLEGLLEDFHMEITEEDIAEARREMWGNFHRERGSCETRRMLLRKRKMKPAERGDGNCGDSQ